MKQQPIPIHYRPSLTLPQLLFCLITAILLALFGGLLAAFQTKVVLGIALSPVIYLMPITVSAIFGFMVGLIYIQWRSYARFLEQSYQRKEQNYRHLFENATDIIYTLDPTTGLFTSINRVVEDILGYTSEEIITMSLNELFTPSSLDAFQPKFQAKLQGEPQTTYEIEAIAKDGQLIPLEIKSRLVKDDQGVIKVHGIARDITKRKMIQRALLESEHFNKTIISSVQEGVAVCDQNLQCLLWNQFMEKLIGVTADKVMQQDIRNFLPDPEANDHLQQAINGQASRSQDLVYSIHGETHWLISRYSPHVSAKGEIVGVVIMINDITTRHQLEIKLRQSQKMEAVGQLAGGVAHEFNNLLTTIIGYAELALITLPTASPIEADLKGILRKANRAATLVQQLLNFSRHPLSEPHPINLNRFLVDTSHLFNRFTHPDIELTVTIEPNLAQVIATPGQIEEILLNLVANAYDAMPQGGEIQVNITDFEATTANAELPMGFKLGQYIFIEVSDNGVGMTENVKTNIFDLFFTTKEIGQGAGLGLAIVFGIVQQLEGHIGVESAVGQGTTFKVYLPAIKTQAKASNFLI